MFSICIGMIIFTIIDSVFAMLSLASTYSIVLIIQFCTLQHYLIDIIQGQVAYSLLVYAIHRIGPQEWKNKIFIWFGYILLF